MMSTASFARPTYRPDIDGLRAIAVLAVMVFHAFPQALPGGFTGVDVFFVISGFLITTLILENRARGAFSLLGFYVRRARRIFPALVTVLVAACVVGWGVLLPDEYRQLGRHVAGGAGFVANFLLWGEAGYFDSAAEAKPLLHLWSLGIEEQFYILWPSLLLLGGRLRLPALGVAALLACASFGFNLVTAPVDGVAAFYAPHARLWELLCGACLAAWSVRCGAGNVRLHGVVALGAALCGTVLLASSFTVIDRNAVFPGWWALAPVAGTAALIAAGPHSWINRALLSHRVLVGIGLISYPLYLWHWLLLSFARIVAGATPPASLRLTLLALSVLLAWLTYRLVERPFRTGGRGGMKAVVLALLLACVGSAGYAIYVADGLPNRPGLAAPVEQAHKYSIMRLMGRSPAARLMLLGDSHAMHLDPGLFSHFGRQIAVYDTTACLPFFDVDRYDHRSRPGVCTAKIGGSLRDFLNNKRMTGLIIASMGTPYLTGEAFGGLNRARVTGQVMLSLTHPEWTDRWQIYENGLRETLRRVTAAGRDVLFLFDVPELGFDPKSCFTERPFELIAKRDPCAVSRRAYDERTARYKSVTRAVLNEFPMVRVYDPTGDFCDKDWCWAMRDGILFYRDADHLNDAGSAFIAARMAPLVDAMLRGTGEPPPAAQK